jgi:hypothetical protein
MTADKPIGCKEGKDTFHCHDCRYRDDTPGCADYRRSWDLIMFYGREGT